MANAKANDRPQTRLPLGHSLRKTAFGGNTLQGWRPASSARETGVPNAYASPDFIRDQVNQDLPDYRLQQMALAQQLAEAQERDRLLGELYQQRQTEPAEPGFFGRLFGAEEPAVDWDTIGASYQQNQERLRQLQAQQAQVANRFDQNVQTRDKMRNIIAERQRRAAEAQAAEAAARREAFIKQYQAEAEKLGLQIAPQATGQTPQAAPAPQPAPQPVAQASKPAPQAAKPAPKPAPRATANKPVQNPAATKPATPPAAKSTKPAVPNPAAAAVRRPPARGLAARSAVRSVTPGATPKAPVAAPKPAPRRVPAGRPVFAENGNLFT